MKTLIKLSILFFFFIFSESALYSQTSNHHRKCATVEVNNSLFNSNPELLIRYKKTQEFINQYIQEHQGLSTKSVINIPVVVHVVLSPTQMAGFPDSRINEQIDALNRDFSGLNPHSMGPFSVSLKTNTNIQFYLANIDSNGISTNGIERRNYTGTPWGVDQGIKHYSNGGLNAWNPNNFFNFWIGDLGPGLCGYAIYTSTPLSYEFGLVMQYEYVGITGASAPFDNGSQSTHEMAHCFNLKHIWGDGIGCGTDDLCADTPPQDIETYGNPVAPLYDVCTSSGTGIMFMNFMDYVDDIASANFTPNQATQMQACFAPGGPLETLGQSQLICDANAGNDTTFCGLALQLNATVNAGDYNTHWIIPAGVSLGNVYSPNASGAASAPGTYNLVWEVTNSLGVTCNDTVSITLTLQPLANAGPDATACGQTVLLSADNTYPGYWTSVPPNATFYPSVNDPNSSVLIPLYVQTSTSYTFSWHANNGACYSSDNVTITFIKTPHAEAGNTQSVCGTTTQLTADTIGTYINNGWWTCNVPGVIITPTGSDPVQWNPTVDASSLVPGFWVNSQHDVWFYWHGQSTSTGCTSIDSVTVAFYEIPNANAGIDTSICGKTYDLNASWSIDNPSGIWSSILNPATANFVPTNIPSSIVTVSQNGLFYFVWKEMNAGNTSCFDRDTITVDFRQVPTPDAGLDISVCGKFAYICATRTPSVTNGEWAVPPGIAFYDAPIDSAIHFNVSYQDSACTWIRYGSENEMITIRWVEFNGQCYGNDSVNVYFGSIQPAVHLVDPADSVVCGPVYTLLNAQNPSYGYGEWQDILINTTFTPSAINPNATAIIDSSVINNFGYHGFRWITINGNCRDTSETIKVNFKTSKIIGIAQSSLVSDFSTFKAELLPEINYNNNLNNLQTLTSGGNFSLWVEPNQNYYLKIYSTNPSLYPSLANTYYNGSYSWQNATVLTNTGNCDTINVTVPLVAMTPATGGNCRIYGLVRYDGSLNPVSNAMVYLRYQPNQDPARFEYTNPLGYYSINNIAIGNYKLFVDIPGLPQITNHHIVVNSNDTVFANVNFIVDTTSISKQYGFGIYADTTGFISVPITLTEGIEISVFPNPFADNIYISGTIKNSESISSEIIDNTGKIIFNTSEKNFSAGKFTLPVSTPEMAKGIYFVKVMIGNSTYIKKISKL